ncbi:hypothetical protein B0A53_06263 [Rhodotorula sp. CCFEE 5036]|nr:hypothetical protein B0A53_06263 [Rhodotorula sp. CCFEE 5036]
MHALFLVLASILSARLVHSAAPNPHQLFALQSAAALADAAATANSTAYAIAHEEEVLPRPRGGMYKRHRRPRMGGLKHGHHRDVEARTARQEGELLHQRSLEAGLERERIRRTTASDLDKRGNAASDLDKRGNGGVWTGVSSYYLFALYDSDRYAVLDAIKSGGFSVVRIFIAGVGANNKGSNSRAVNDVEPNEVGVYDDTILGLVDQLMVDCKERGLKLLIALSDRYALGFWSTDCYATHLNIVQPGSFGAQKVADASKFYTDEWTISMFEKRLAHIMKHSNALMGGRTWAELESVIFAVEPQNEPQGHMLMASSTWACDRAAYLKSLIKSNILVSSGGGITTTDSLGSWAVNCDSIDIVSVHDYGTSAGVTASALASARSNHPDKQIIMGEWGVAGANKAQIVAAFVAAFRDQGLSWMYWEVVRPGKAASDFEVWTDEPAWQALIGQPYTVSPASSTSSWAASSKAASPTSSSSSPAWSSSAAVTTTWSPSPTTTAAWSKTSTWTSSSSPAAWTPSSSSVAWTPSSSAATWTTSTRAWTSSSAPAWSPAPSSSSSSPACVFDRLECSPLASSATRQRTV